MEHGDSGRLKVVTIIISLSWTNSGSAQNKHIFRISHMQQEHTTNKIGLPEAKKRPVVGSV